MNGKTKCAHDYRLDKVFGFALIFAGVVSVLFGAGLCLVTLRGFAEGMFSGGIDQAMAQWGSVRMVIFTAFCGGGLALPGWCLACGLK